MEPVATVGKWIVLLAAPVLAFLAVAFLTFWRPEPGDPVEYLAREDAVLVQMITVGGLAGSTFADRLTLPDFTLYGDGTVIYQGPPGSGELVEAEIPGQAVQDLLEYFEGKAFFDFQYEQPVDDNIADAGTTYIYAQTKEAANAASAYALGTTTLPDESESDEFRRLGEIKERLEAFDPEAVGGRVVGPYNAEAVLLVVEPADPPQTVGRPTQWPVPEVDLASMAPPESGAVERVLEGEPARAITETFVSPPSGLPITFFQNGRFFRVAWRPVLPFEEHFPEFDFGAN
jgi:hypothetical protein